MRTFAILRLWRGIRRIFSQCCHRRSPHRERSAASQKCNRISVFCDLDTFSSDYEAREMQNPNNSPVSSDDGILYEEPDYAVPQSCFSTMLKSDGMVEKIEEPFYAVPEPILPKWLKSRFVVERVEEPYYAVPKVEKVEESEYAVPQPTSPTLLKPKFVVEKVEESDYAVPNSFYSPTLKLEVEMDKVEKSDYSVPKVLHLPSENEPVVMSNIDDSTLEYDSPVESCTNNNVHEKNRFV